MSFSPEFETTKLEIITTKKRDKKAANPKEEKSWDFRLLLFLGVLKMPEQLDSRKHLMVTIMYICESGSFFVGQQIGSLDFVIDS
jgi:hypothetical protein